jgi:arylsulfatase A-like enzyme
LRDEGQLQGGIRVPLLLQWKGKEAGHEVADGDALELLPTTVAAAGAKLPAKLDGVDLLPF